MKVLKVMASLLMLVGTAAQARTININYGDGTTIADLSGTQACKIVVGTFAFDPSTGVESFRREADPRMSLMITAEQEKIENVTNNAVIVSVTEYRMQPQCLPYVTKSKRYMEQDDINLNITYEALKDWQTKAARRRRRAR